MPEILTVRNEITSTNNLLKKYVHPELAEEFEGHESVITICPYCKTQISSTVERKLSKYNWRMCLVCCCITP